MNWHDWKAWAQKQRKRTSWSLVLTVTPPWEANTEEMEGEYRESIRNHVKTYCKRLRWPKMTDQERCLIYYRMERVESLISSLARSNLPPPTREQFAETVEWLLVTNWEWRDWHDWTSYLRWARMAGEIKALKMPTPVPKNPSDGFAA